MRVHNFSAGPAMLPLPVLEQLREELPDWQSSGMTVMEVSHRGAAFIRVAEQAEAKLRALLQVPSNYSVLFLQGGATGQFCAVPMNLAAADSTVAYVDTGIWSEKAIAEARKFCVDVQVVASAGEAKRAVPPQSTWRSSTGARYLHYTPNETIGGLAFPFIPETDAVPLVADYSSALLSEPLDVSRFGLIYAGAQKNIGIAGLCLVLVRQDLLDRARAATPAVWQYRRMSDAGSMLNTPPTFAWYVARLVFNWITAQGGLKLLGQRNRARAQRLYQQIDATGFYANAIAPTCRSIMNVTFSVRDAALESIFLAEAHAEGLENLRGHRAVGGLRASIYNAMPDEGVKALGQFMQEFERRHG